VPCSASRRRTSRCDAPPPFSRPCAPKADAKPASVIRSRPVERPRRRRSPDDVHPV
jgi:hypothetical protein